MLKKPLICLFLLNASQIVMCSGHNPESIINMIKYKKNHLHILYTQEDAIIGFYKRKLEREHLKALQDIEEKRKNNPDIPLSFLKGPLKNIESNLRKLLDEDKDLNTIKKQISNNKNDLVFFKRLHEQDKKDYPDFFEKRKKTKKTIL